MTEKVLAKRIEAHFKNLAQELKIKENQIINTFELLDGGATIPFIARYRKEQTGSINEEILFLIEEKIKTISELEERKQTVLKRIESLGVLTEGLKQSIEEAKTKIALEDIYLPFKPKKQTRATKAIKSGLEPLSKKIQMKEFFNIKSTELTAEFLNDEIKTAEEAIQGAMDILAEKISENIEWKAFIREKEAKNATWISSAREKNKEKKSKFEMYYEFSEPVSTIPSHRVLAIRRGEKEGFLKTSIEMDDVGNINYLKKRAISHELGLYSENFNNMVGDAYSRLIKLTIETELRLILKKKADKAAYEVFRKNIKDIMLAPPATNKVILGVDPGFKSGTKLAIIDSTGKFLDHKTIYPIAPQNQAAESKMILLAMIENFKVEIIAIGNGTASREIQDFVTESIQELENPPIALIASEAGASVYSASLIARKEFPDLDVTIRGAISIARRVQDPLAELVKIDPKSIGVGQYQHDVNQKELKEKLEQVVLSCVNTVGVNINTASESLLGYVSGVNKVLAKNIVEYRRKNGSFSSRSVLVKIPSFGPKTFEQAAGFLRILNAENPLDGTAVHPERYEIVNQICEKEGCELKEILSKNIDVNKIDFGKYENEEIGLPTLQDIKEELERPNRDPRKRFVYAKFNPNVKKISDLKENLWLEGVVTNMTDFGVFVDIGVHQDGMIHVSELLRKTVKNTSNEISTGDVIKVRVLSADAEQKRISLSMREESDSNGPKGFKRPKRKKATINQLKTKFSTDSKKKQNNVKLKFSLKSIMKSGR